MDRVPSFMRLYTHGKKTIATDVDLHDGQVIIMPGSPAMKSSPARDSVLFIGGDNGLTWKITWEHTRHHGGLDKGPVEWQEQGATVKNWEEDRG